MESQPKIENSQESFPFETKTLYRTQKEINEILFEGRPVNFIVTKDYNIWLTDGPHQSITDRGYQSDDIKSMGFIKITDRKPYLDHYGGRPDDFFDIRQNILNFFKLNSDK